MAYVPRELPPENVNVSPQHPLGEFVWLLGGLIGLLLGSFVLLGFAVDWIVPHVPPTTEQALGQMFTSVYAKEQQGPSRDRLQQLLDRLSARLPDKPVYQLHLVPEDTVNAMALPGGDIVIYTGLLAQAKSENELALVLGHEIAHLHYRHSLRALGRALVLVTLSDLALGPNNGLSGLVYETINGAQMRFSQDQESACDALGLRLLVETYGHAGGATDFFSRLAAAKTLPEHLAYLDSHPHPAARVRQLQQLIAAAGYRQGQLTPMHVD
ncbi:MAG: peptidase M48 [Candidatus Melainabacteria bacterium HGW-Melainabacteria-1]|nr:MAG: peptidase M48 [Candidatus Melainabacteria bacterium HGW-Melainabacteria-1]